MQNKNILIKEPPTTKRRPQIKRKKVAVEPGYGLRAWTFKMSSFKTNQKPECLQKYGYIPMSEVAKHNTEDDAWCVLRGKVYDITPFVKYHPGGKEFLMLGAGKDMTVLYDKYHSWVVGDFLLQHQYIGPAEPLIKRAPNLPMKVKCSKIVKLNENIKLFEFALKKKLNFKPGQYATFKFLIDDLEPIRHWTITRMDDKSLEIIVKLKEYGRVTSFLHHSFGVGMSANLLEIEGDFTCDDYTSKKLFFLTGGIGITPIIAMVRSFDLKNVDVILVHSEKTLHDFVFKDELSKYGNENVSVHVTLTREDPPKEQSNITFHSGRVSYELIKKVVADVQERQIYLCGPIEFMDSCKEILSELGVSSEQIRAGDFDF